MAHQPPRGLREPSSPDPARAEGHLHQAHRRRNLRAVHPQEVSRCQAFLPRRGGDPDPAPRPGPRRGRRARGPGGGLWYGPPRSAQRPGQHPRQEPGGRSSDEFEDSRLRGAGSAVATSSTTWVSAATTPPRNGDEVHLSMCFNPSHLEFVNPVALGSGARQAGSGYGDTDHRQCMAILIHGDAAFSGQGVIARSSSTWRTLSGYRTGGALPHHRQQPDRFHHLPRECPLDPVYATDVARMLQTPVFHVNGEDPEAVAHVVRTAMDYRHEFGTDVIIDMYCYRRYGHNEGDEPSYTQPLALRDHPQAQDRSARVTSTTSSTSVAVESRRGRPASRPSARKPSRPTSARARREPRGDPGYRLRGRQFRARASGVTYHWWARPAKVEPAVETGSAQGAAGGAVCRPFRRRAGTPSISTASSSGSLASGLSSMADGEKALLDWGTAEALAFASLVAEGSPVRLSGQDCGRGTFSHRHAILYDYRRPVRHATSRSTTLGGRTRLGSRSGTARCPRSVCSASSTATVSIPPMG